MIWINRHCVNALAKFFRRLVTSINKFYALLFKLNNTIQSLLKFSKKLTLDFFVRVFSSIFKLLRLNFRNAYAEVLRKNLLGLVLGALCFIAVGFCVGLSLKNFVTQLGVFLCKLWKLTSNNWILQKQQRVLAVCFGVAFK